MGPIDEHLRLLPQSLQRQTLSDDNHLNTQPWSSYAIVYLNNMLKAQKPKRPVWTRRFCVLLQILGGIAFIVTCVTLRPTLTSAADTKRATQLAQWESNKEFLEFCETHEFNTTACLSAQNLTLNAPPGFMVSKWRRSLSGNPMQIMVGFHPILSSHATWIIFGVLVCLAAILGIVKRHQAPLYLRRSKRWLEGRNFSPSKKRVGETVLPYHNSDVTQSPPLLSVALPKEGIAKDIVKDTVKDNSSNSEPVIKHAVASTTATNIQPIRNIQPHFRHRGRFTRHKPGDNHNHEAMDDSSDDEMFTSGSTKWAAVRRGRLKMRKRVKRAGASEG
ncbi:hypothetical protein QBC38DRAFT_61783 [Podospora fimiseda]|uniref:Uncharacterized protein n=1 Tax=Podospora fimiseda TaxID=252190 RepID=A0AAN7BEN3_9PEZI|nr:hypothetical protein QBC38DRAFT_61783 [Podospora fimiseda]